MDLNEYLNDLALESGVVTEVSAPVNETVHAGADELTVVTDDIQTELEESLTTTGEAVAKLNTSDAAASKLVDAVESLESMMYQLESFESAGIPLDTMMSGFFMQNVALCLEARDFDQRLYADDIAAATASFEAAQLALPGPDSKSDNTGEAKAKTGNIITRLWQMLKSAVAKGIERLTNWWNSVGKSASAVKASGQRLKEVAKKISGSPEGKLKSGSFTKLTVGGKVSADHALQAVESGYTNGVLSVTKDFREVTTALIAALGKGDSGAVGAFARSIDTKLHAHEQDICGGYKMSFRPGAGGGFDGLMKAKFSISRSDKPSAGEAELAPLSAAEIAQLGARLESLGSMMEKISKDSHEAVNGAKGVLAAAEKANNKTDTKLENKEANQLFSTAQKLVSQTAQFGPAYVSIMGEIAKEAYKLGMQSAAKHKGGGAATGADKGATDKGDDKQAGKDPAGKSQAAIGKEGGKDVAIQARGVSTT